MKNRPEAVGSNFCGALLSMRVGCRAHPWESAMFPMLWRVFQIAVIIGIVWMYHEISIEDGTPEQLHIAFIIGGFLAWFLTILLTWWSDLILRLWARLSAPRSRATHIGQSERQIGGSYAPLRLLGETLQDRTRRRVG